MTPNDNLLVEIYSFDSWDHYDEVSRRFDAAVAAGTLTEVEPTRPYSIFAFDQRWFRAPSGEVWRLVKPDPPFKGTLEVVENPDAPNPFASLLEAIDRRDTDAIRAELKDAGVLSQALPPAKRGLRDYFRFKGWRRPKGE